MLRRHGPKMPGAIVCDRWREMTWDDLIEVGNAGWRGSDALAPSFLVRVRVGQSQRDAVQQHPKFEAAIARARAEAGAGAAGCKLSKVRVARRAKPAVRLAVRMTLWTALKAMRRAARQMGRRQLT